MQIRAMTAQPANHGEIQISYLKDEGGLLCKTSGRKDLRTIKWNQLSSSFPRNLQGFNENYTKELADILEATNKNEQEKLKAAKICVFFEMQNAIPEYSNQKIKEDDQYYTFEEFINKFCFNGSKSREEALKSFLIKSLADIELSIKEILEKLKTEKGIFYGRNNRQENYSTILRTRLSALTYPSKNREGILSSDNHNDSFIFVAKLRDLDEIHKVHQQAFNHTNSNILLAQSNKLTNTQASDDVLKKINQNLTEYLVANLKDDQQQSQDILDKIKSIVDKLCNELENLVKAEREHCQKNILYKQNLVNDEGDIEVKVDNILNPFQNEDSVKEYISLVLERELLESDLNPRYETPTQEHHKSYKFTAKKIKEAAESPLVISAIKQDIQDLKDYIEFIKLKSLADKNNTNSILKQWVEIENDTNGYFFKLSKTLSELTLKAYQDGKKPDKINPYEKLLNDKLALLNPEQLQRAKDLFNQRTKIIRQLDDLCTSIQAIDINITKFITEYLQNTRDDTTGTSLAIGLELQKSSDESYQDKLTEINLLNNSLLEYSATLIQSEESDKALGDFALLLNNQEKTLKILAEYSSARMEFYDNIETTKNNIIREQAVSHHPLPEPVNVKEIELNKDFPLSNDINRNTEFDADIIRLGLDKAECTKKYQNVLALRRALIEEKNSDIVSFVEAENKYKQEKLSLEKRYSSVNLTIEQTNALNAYRKEQADIAAENLRLNVEEFKLLSNKLANIKLDYNAEKTFENDALKQSLATQEALLKKIKEGNEQRAKIQSINSELQDSNLYLSAQKIQDSLSQLDVLYGQQSKPTSGELNDFNTSANESNSIYANLLERERIISEARESYNTHKNTLQFNISRLNALKDIFSQSIPDYAVNLKYRHNECIKVFDYINIEDGLTKACDIIATRLEDLDKELTENVTDHTIQNNKLNESIKDKLEKIKNLLAHLNAGLCQVDDPEQNEHIKPFCHNNNLDASSISIKVKVDVEKIELKARYKAVSSYLHAVVKNEHLSVRPAFGYRNIKTPQDQHLALNNMHKFALNLNAENYDNEQYKTNLLQASDRRPPFEYSNFDLGLIKKEKVAKKEPGFFQKCKNYLGAIIGGVTGAAIGAGIGALIGFFLLPVTFGISVPLGAAIGGVVGGAAVGCGAGAGIGYLVDTCIRSCSSREDEPSSSEESDSLNDEDHRQEEKPDSNNLNVQPNPQSSIPININPTNIYSSNKSDGKEELDRSHSDEKKIRSFNSPNTALSFLPNTPKNATTEREGEDAPILLCSTSTMRKGLHSQQAKNSNTETKLRSNNSDSPINLRASNERPTFTNSAYLDTITSSSTCDKPKGNNDSNTVANQPAFFETSRTIGNKGESLEVIRMPIKKKPQRSTGINPDSKSTQQRHSPTH